MYQNPERLGREQPIEITAGVQGNYPNFKQKLAGKKFCHLKSQQKPAAVFRMPSQSSNAPKVGNWGTK